MPRLEDVDVGDLWWLMFERVAKKVASAKREDMHQAAEGRIEHSRACTVT
jgi:hypothetical protein